MTVTCTDHGFAPAQLCFRGPKTHSRKGRKPYRSLDRRLPRPIPAATGSKQSRSSHVVLTLRLRRAASPSAQPPPPPAAEPGRAGGTGGGTRWRVRTVWAGVTHPLESGTEEPAESAITRVSRVGK